MSGELWLQGDDSPADRLPPQPARLLLHLIARRPHLVTRREIRQLLWPDVTVEFDEGLHTCVRRIRQALGESAAEPRYIETVPRRGYRFVGTVEGDGPTPAVVVAPPARRHLPTVLAGSIVVALVAWAALRPAAVQPAAPLRVAVMPFEPRAGGSALPPGNDLAETLVELLANRADGIEVVGPTTTRRYEDRPEGLAELIGGFAVDYVVNARETVSDAGPRVLLEIIRSTDGAHVWVRFLDELPPGEVAATIAGAVPARR